MKYSNSSNSSTLFCEQVGTVTSLFEKWNNCERTVVLYALLKRITFTSLKFLQLSIECNLTQNFSLQTKTGTFEKNANCPSYLRKLIETYKTFPNSDISSLTSKDSALYESDLYLSEIEKIYDKKEDILEDILVLLQLLRPGNDAAKAIYLSIIPLAVEDTVREIVGTEIVQQIFSYLLIHPAILNEDRRSLSQWLRHLEDHIHSTFNSQGSQSFYTLPHANDKNTMHSSSNTSTSSLNTCNTNNWQAIAPPSHSSHKSLSSSSSNSSSVHAATATSSSANNINLATSTNPHEWDINLLQITPNFCDELKLTDLNNATASQNSLGLIYDSAVVASSQSNSSSDDHHVSFSKNGTEIDFDEDINGQSNTQIAFDSLLPSSVGDHLNVPLMDSFCHLDGDNGGIKTRRSNSLTTPVTASSCVNPYTANAYSNSNENLAQYAQKPRSFSLSMETPRNALTSSGSDTRLDDMKPNYLKFTTHNIGMSNIAQWLKSLRLHKYVWLFTNMTYEQMLEITEEYLQNLGVTKGASHKLALCIEKLKDRYGHLATLEKDLAGSKMTITAVLEELSNIVLTPMKPVDALSKDNVAGQFLRVLDLVSQTVAKKPVTSSQEEESVTAILWILDRCIHSEAFVAHTNQLKEHKFKLSKIKMQFPQKGHYGKNGNGAGNLNKPRWNNGNKSHKPVNTNGGNGGNVITNAEKSHRKNSNGMPNFNLNSSQQTSSCSTTATNNPNISVENEKFHGTKSTSLQSQQQQQPQPQQIGFFAPPHQKQPLIVSTVQTAAAAAVASTANSCASGNGSSSSNITKSNSTTLTSCGSQYNKSSSYPNFITNSSKTSVQQQSQQIPNQSQSQQASAHQQQQQQQQHLQQSVIQQQQQQPHYRHHRHSLNNLIVLSGNPQQQQHVTFKTGKQTPAVLNRTGSCLGNTTTIPASDLIKGRANSNGKPTTVSASAATSQISLIPTTTKSIETSVCGQSVAAKKPNGNAGAGNSNIREGNTKNSSNIGDINSSLEFLCLQMTEQAIN